MNLEMISHEKYSKKSISQKFNLLTNNCFFIIVLLISLAVILSRWAQFRQWLYKIQYLNIF